MLMMLTPGKEMAEDGTFQFHAAVYNGVPYQQLYVLVSR